MPLASNHLRWKPLGEILIVIGLLCPLVVSIESGPAAGGASCDHSPAEKVAEVGSRVCALRGQKDRPCDHGQRVQACIRDVFVRTNSDSLAVGWVCDL